MREPSVVSRRRWLEVALGSVAALAAGTACARGGVRDAGGAAGPGASARSADALGREPRAAADASAASPSDAGPAATASDAASESVVLLPSGRVSDDDRPRLRALLTGARAAVDQYWAVVGRPPLRVELTSGGTIPYYERGLVSLPTRRLADGGLDLPWMEEDFLHEAAHHATGHGSTHFLKEGVAVHTQEAVLGERGQVPMSWPLFGRASGDWAALLGRRSARLPLSALARRESYDGSSAQADFESWQLYVVAGSVIGYLRQTAGREAVLEAFAEGALPPGLEGPWSDAISRRYPSDFDPAAQVPASPRYQSYVRFIGG